jgi:peptidoglycan hydrolase-like protein with peptidoglycan-binding domain
VRCALAGAVLLVGALVTTSSASADSSLVLGIGSRGAPVARWQQILDTWLGASGSRFARGFERAHGRLAQDGIFGRETEAATRAFQRESRIAVTGAVDARTRLTWVGANVTCCGAGYPRVGPGDVSGAVGWWQVALDRWLARRGAARQLLVDGVFGPATRSATIAFQRATRLRTTGLAGPACWKAMERRNLLHVP